MADINQVNYDYIIKWEGGLSCNKLDSASKHPVPDTHEHPNPKGYHTMRGVTWMAWRSIFKNNPQSIADFYKMPKDKWLKIYKWYWDLVGASQIDNQIIAELMADWAWGSGVNACFQLQKFLNLRYGYELKVDGKVGKRTIKALNDAIMKEGSVDCYKALFKFRCDWIKTIPSFRDFGRGWMNRLNDFDRWALKELERG